MQNRGENEFHAYEYLKYELLKKKGWINDQLYIRQECLSIKPIAKQLGLTNPDGLIEIGKKEYYVIEAKNARNEIELALKEAREEYAEKINRGGEVNAHFITGLAGNDSEGFICKSEFLKDGKWKKITENNVELSGLLSKLQVESILKQKDNNIKEVEITDEEFLHSAEEINGILHEGGIHKDYRARVISAILLALAEGTEINLDERPSVLVDSINSRVDLILRKHKKPEFARFIKIDLPSSEDNHNKFKKALVLTIQELLGLNIRSAMNSGKDILGKFYEVFLKYGNGAKEIGIVLTPRHITKFAAEVLDVKANDLVLDPTCGTGGFLVAAFDKVRNEAPKNEFETFKMYGLYGIEQQDAVVALAIVNMIFRGDGKNNIIEGDCFAQWLNATTKNNISVAEYISENKSNRVPPITKILMNPPFPKKKTDYKPYLFIEHALKQMQDEGLLFSILPYSSMVKSGGYLNWRKRLLQGNTLLAVVTFSDVFYPIGVNTIGLIIKKGVPQPEDNKVLWIRALNDGYLKHKGKRMENSRAKNDFPMIVPLLKSFIKNQGIEVKNIPALIKAAPINFRDTLVELIPEAYLDDKEISSEQLQNEIENLMRENIAFKIKFEKKLDG